MGNATRNLRLWVLLSSIGFVVLGLLFFFYVSSEEAVDTQNEKRAKSLLLSEELHDSSENLTNMVRSYLMTGDSWYKQSYLSILAIRDGRVPRPGNYRFFWDQILPGQAMPVWQTESDKPIMRLIENAAFGAYEEQLLATAKTNSDILSQKETAAMALFEDAKGNAADVERARSMLFDSSYLSAKMSIMKPISEFGALMDLRMATAVNDARRVAMVFRLIFAGGGVVWLLSLWRSYAALQAVLGGSPRHIYNEIEALGRGDFSSTSAQALKQDTVAAWLSVMRRNLNEILAKRDQAERERAAIAEDRARIADQLKRAAELHKLISESSDDVITVFSLPDLRYEYVSPSVHRHRGYTQEEMTKHEIGELMPAASRDFAKNNIAEMLAQIKAGDTNARFKRFEIELNHRDGYVLPFEISAAIYFDEYGQPAKLVTVARDIRDRKAKEEIIKHMAYYDRLTNLPNRRLLEDRLHQFMAKAEREKTKLALLFVDLDKFKPVNDTLGHDVGDWLLQQVAARMSACLRTSDTVARIGGDEFVVLLPTVPSIETAQDIAEKIRLAIQEPYDRDQTKIEIAASIGVAMFPDHATTVRDLLHLSDVAMYSAKSGGRNAVEVYKVAKGRTPKKKAQT